METRLATKDDAFLLAGLHAESFGVARWNLQQITESLALETTRGWIASQDKKPQGFILYQFMGNEVEILTFCVTPSARRQGIAQNLLQKTIAEARRQSAQRIFLEVAVDNSGAIALYEKAGFQKMGLRKNYYKRDDKNVDAVMLILTVS